MVKCYRNFVGQLEEDIENLSIDINDVMLISEATIKLILSRITQTKHYVVEKGFKNIDEEVYFFKHLKPTIISKLIYHNAIHKIEVKIPFGGDKSMRKYLKNELDKLKKFFDNNRDFYKYYRTNSTYLDYTYFVRGKHDIKLSLDTFYFETDFSFATSHDYKVAKIIANDLIRVYLEHQLNNKNQKKLLKNLH